ncbi:Penicillinase repressor [Eubacteriaceae bacterium CHKCI004]|nr:Penicillinase repressor [Eubacteriaceae bacterium CHKCI004]
MKKITDSEREVLNLLWDMGEPLSSTEIVKLSVDKTWKPSYIHIMIKSLLDKEMIRVAGFKKTTKNYARVFEPTMTREQWSLIQIKQGKNEYGDLIKKMLVSFLQEETDEKILSELSESITKRKKELNDVSS